MAQGRNPKRARKKDRRNARREEWMREYQKRRRQRRFVLLGSLIAVVIAGLLVFYFLKPAGKKHALASPTPAASVAAATSKDKVACGGTVPAAAHQTKKTYSAPEDQGLDPNTRYTWKLQTSCGEIDIGLDAKDSPKTVNSIIFLTRQGFYDGLLFHRIAPDFVIQGGDPKGDGSGGPGYTVVDKVPPGFQYQVGTVAMAKTQTDPPGTAGSQFFIVTSDAGSAPLNQSPVYGVLGEVLTGQDVVQKIAATGTVDGSPPTAYTYIDKATIVEG